MKSGFKRREYYAANKEKLCAQARALMHRNPHRNAIYRANRKAKRQAMAAITHIQWTSTANTGVEKSKIDCIKLALARAEGDPMMKWVIGPSPELMPVGGG